ncbi:MAG: A/G-specific adenine glycosylase [Candidatus Pacebacteria bacterium]|nr:A/G-specific adenine glycosylase [Candidatus Paceibacterota bacterium]
MDTKDIRRIRDIVWIHYKKAGRHDLPWRNTMDPYHILVSEIMLQQTQVMRVIPKYQEFLKKFPTVHTLACASLRDVLVVWQGLGYNRRAKMLHEAIGIVAEKWGGCIPTTYDELVTLPGVGPYTARAVCVFAYNEPGGMVETNIRTVFFHHIFSFRTEVPDTEILPISTVLCPKDKAREWYWALMDYGSYLKEQGVRVNATSKHYIKQSKFEGSDRQIRGAILRFLTEENRLGEGVIAKKAKAPLGRVRVQLQKMVEEKIIQRYGKGRGVAYGL